MASKIYVFFPEAFQGELPGESSLGSTMRRSTTPTTSELRRMDESKQDSFAMPWAASLVEERKLETIIQSSTMFALFK